VAERNRQDAAAGQARANNANNLKTENQRHRETWGGNQTKMQTGNAAAGREQNAMNQQKMKQMSGGQYRQQQMGGGQYQQQKMAAQRRAQMQGGGNRPPPSDQQQQERKKKPNPY
jgi:hypothetical protein